MIGKGRGGGGLQGWLSACFLGLKIELRVCFFRWEIRVDKWIKSVEIGRSGLKYVEVG